MSAVFGYLQPGWKNSSILRLASGDVRSSCIRADIPAAALVCSNISRSYSFTAEGKSSECAASARPSTAPLSSAMLAPSPTGGIRRAASPSSVTSGLDGQVRPIGRLVIDRGTTVSSQAAIQYTVSNHAM